MTEEPQLQTTRPPKSPRRRARSRLPYVLLGIAGIVVIVQVVALMFPREKRVAVNEAATPRPTRTATPAATPVPSTNTPSPTWTPLSPTDTPTPRPANTAVPTNTPAPTNTPEPTPTPTLTSTPEGTLGASYVRDVTIPDNAVITPGKSFDKTWRIRNSGTQTWPSDARLAFVEGQEMGGSASDPVGREVAPGGEVDITVSMTASTQPGTYKGTWQMQAPGGEFFGSKVYVIIRSGTFPTATSVPTAVPAAAVTLLNMVEVDNIEGWGKGWIQVKYQDYVYVDGSDGHRYRAEMGFLSSPESLATIQQFWTYGGRGSATWKMILQVRTSVNWVSCSSSEEICYESSAWSSQAILTSEVFYRSKVWSSLLDSYLAGGLIGTTRNAYYHDIQQTMYEPICGVVPDQPTIGFQFTRVD